MALPLNSIVHVSWRGVYASQRIIFGMNYKVAGTASITTEFADLQNIAEFFAAPGAGSPLSAYLSLLPSNYTCQEVRAQKLTPARSIYVSASVNLPGTFDDIAVTGNLQHPVTFHTELAGRDEISVVKIGPAPDSSMSNGAPTVAYTNLLDAFGNELIGQQTVNPDAIQLRPAIPRANFTQSELIIGFRLPNRTGTMRRRTLRVGE